MMVNLRNKVVLAPQDSTPTPSLLISTRESSTQPYPFNPRSNSQDNYPSFLPHSPMNFIFKSKQRTPAELIKHLREAIHRLDAGGSGGSGANSEGKRKVSLTYG